MKRRSFLKSLFFGATTLALPAPRLAGLLTDGKPVTGGIRFAGIRERRHVAIWDTIVIPKAPITFGRYAKIAKMRYRG